MKYKKYSLFKCDFNFIGQRLRMDLDWLLNQLRIKIYHLECFIEFCGRRNDISLLYTDIIDYNSWLIYYNTVI